MVSFEEFLEGLEREKNRRKEMEINREEADRIRHERIYKQEASALYHRIGDRIVKYQRKKNKKRK